MLHIYIYDISHLRVNVLHFTTSSKRIEQKGSSSGRRLCVPVWYNYTGRYNLYLIILFDFIVPTLVSLVGGPLSGNGCGSRINSVISCLLVGLFTQFIFDKLTHCGRVTQICVFNTVKLGTSASSP